MAEFFKFKDRGETLNGVNWEESAGKLVTKIGDAYKRREERKDAIDQAERELTQTLADAPSGQHEGLNEYALEAADALATSNLQLHKAYKAGLIKDKDFLKHRQNLESGVNDLYGLINDYNKEWDMKKERADQGISGAQEQWEMAQMEGFTNFSQTGVYIDPNSFKMNIGKKVLKDGVWVLSKDPNDLTTIAGMKNRMKHTTDRFDVDAVTGETAARLGEQVKVIMKGRVKTLSDAMQNPAYIEYEKNQIEQMLTVPSNAASVLADYLGTDDEGNAYDFTTDPKAAGGNLILLEPDPTNPASGKLVPKLTDEQRERAEEALRNSIRAQLSKEETARQEFAPQEWQYKVAKSKDLTDDMTNMVGQLWWGNKSQKFAAMQYFAGLNQNIKSIKQNSNGDYVVKMKDGSSRTVKTTNDQADFIKSATILTGGVDVSESLQRGAYKQGATRNLETPDEYFVSQDDNALAFADAAVTSTDEKGNTTFTPVREILEGVDNSWRWSGGESKRGKQWKAATSQVIETLPAEVRDRVTVTVKGDQMTISDSSKETPIATITLDKGANAEKLIISQIERAYNTLIMNSSDTARGTASNKPSFTEWKKANPTGTYNDWKNL